MKRKNQMSSAGGKRTTPKIKQNFNQWLRIASQVLFFFLLPSLYISAYFGVIDLALALRDGTFTFAGSLADLVPLLASVTVTLLAGRFFCGWMCAFGSFVEMFYRLGSRVFKRRIRVRPSVDRVLRGVKYVVLSVLVLLSILEISVSTFSPWDVFALLLTTGKLPNLALIFPGLLPASILLLAILLASIRIERFFCRYLCPIGAVFSVCSRVSIIRLEKSSEACGNCKACSSACGMGVHLQGIDVIRDGACIRCMKCVDICPKKNIGIRSFHRSMHPILAASIAILLLVGLAVAGNTLADRISAIEDSAAVITVEIQPTPGMTSASSEMSLIPATETSKESTTDPSENTFSTESSTALDTSVTAVAQGNYIDGIYRGTGSGFRGDITVDVTVEGGLITSITVVSSEEDRKYFDRAIDVILDDIYDAQTTQVDVVSGATYSSEGILQAVENALASAGSGA